MKGNCPTCKQDIEVRAYTIIVKEGNTIYSYQGEPDLTYLSLRNRLAGGIKYYKLYLHKDVRAVAQIEAIKRYPELLDKSNWFELI
jgi:hypothetical protein